MLTGWCSEGDNRKLFICPEKGLNKNFYNGIQQATGQYIIFCDQDDLWLNDKVEKLISFHEQNKDASMVYCLSKRFSGTANLSDTRPGIINVLEGSDIKKTMLISFTLGHNLCIKKEILNRLPIPANETVAFDWWITVSCMCIGPIKCLPEILTFWRQHQSNTSTDINYGLFYQNRIAYLKQFLQNPLIDAANKEWIKLAISKFELLDHKQFSWALCWFLFCNAESIFFYKTKTNPILKKISFFKWSIRLSRRSYTV